LRALRWRYLLPDSSKISIKLALDAILIGNFANFILPFRAGEFIRPAFLANNSDVPYISGLSSVVVERFLDLSAVLLSLAVIIPFLPGLPNWAISGSLSLAILAFCIFIGILLASFQVEFTRRTGKQIINFLPKKIHAKLFEILENCIDGASLLRSKRRAGMCLLFTVLVWFSNYLILYIWLFMLPNIPEPEFLHAVTIGVFLALAVAAPSAPGFIGIYQVACLAALALFNVSQEDALTYALVTHMAQYCIYIAYGIYVVNAYGFKIRKA
jgi:uncharacterized protein (TIRG00374 family)